MINVGISAAKSRAALLAAAKHTAAQTVITVIIIGGFTLLEQFWVEELYKCPCLNHENEEERNDNCYKSKRYAWLYVGISSLIIFCLALATVVTARCLCSQTRQKEYEPSGTKATKKFCCYIYHGCNCSPLLLNTGQSVIAVLLWLAVLLIDGDYVACAFTCDPYNNGNCSLSGLPLIDEYKTAKRYSQYVGAGIAGLALIIVITVKFFSCTKCCQRESDRDGCCDCIFSEKLTGDNDKTVMDVIGVIKPAALPAVEQFQPQERVQEV